MQIYIPSFKSSLFSSGQNGNCSGMWSPLSSKKKPVMVWRISPFRWGICSSVFFWVTLFQTKLMEFAPETTPRTGFCIWLRHYPLNWRHVHLNQDFENVRKPRGGFTQPKMMCFFNLRHMVDFPCCESTGYDTWMAPKISWWPTSMVRGCSSHVPAMRGPS